MKNTIVGIKGENLTEKMKRFLDERLKLKKTYSNLIDAF